MTDELDTALASFAQRRSGELARAIEELGRAALVGREPPAPRKNSEFQRGWLELAPDPRARSWCLDTIIDKLPKLLDGQEHPSGDKHEALLERLRVLRQLAPDPRVGRAMLALLELRTPIAGFVVVIDEIARVLVRHADDETRLSPALDELDNFDLELLPAATAKPTARPRRRDLDALYAAVYAAPDDDAPRAVLADALQDAGDPRGELIALQLREHAGDATDEMRERARALVQKHGKTWLGELRPITYRAELRRGFLYELELAGKWSTDKWDALATEPSLATVELLVHGQATGKVVATMLGGVIARTVRSLAVDDDDVWKMIAAAPLPRLRELRAFHWKRMSYEMRFVELVLPYLEQHAQITRVGCALDMVPRFSKALTARLERLSVRGDLAAGLKLWAKLPALRCLRCEWSSDIELVRDGKRELVRVDASTWGSRLELKGLPRSFTRIEVHGNQTFARDLAAKYPKLDIVAMPPPSGKITGVK